MSHALKKNIRAALELNDLDALVSLASGDRTVLNRLVRFAYDKDTLVGWRAIKAAGIVARAFAASDHEFLRDACRKLLWSLSDESGGIGWSAPEMLGEIVSADPQRFADIVPLIAQVYDIEEDVFRGGVLYALCRIGERAPELAAPFQKIIMLSLADKDPMVRVRGIELITVLWRWAKSSDVWSSEYCERARTSLESLTKDKGEAWIYRGNDFTSIQVGEEANKAIKSLR